MSGTLLGVRRLQVRFGNFTALEDVTFDLSAGETLGLVGESGSGKSTLARAILRLIPASGDLLWSGENMLAWSGKQLRQQRRNMQIVFQDPMASLDPRMSVADAIAEPLEIFETALSSAERRSRVVEMLDRVGLPARIGDRRPHEFSGGQCQRIGIARAMILRPRLLVCDEPVSSLDVSIQGQIVNLLADLQKEWGTAMLFISHNLAVVRHVSDRVLVIYRGRAVELATRDALFSTPAHPYTRALLAAVPDLTRRFARAVPAHPVPGASARRDPLPVEPGARGPIPGDPAAEPTAAGVIAVSSRPPADESPRFRGTLPGCAYHGHCRHALEVCRTTVPPLQEVEPGHSAACHRWREVVYS